MKHKWILLIFLLTIIACNSAQGGMKKKFSYKTRTVKRCLPVNIIEELLSESYFITRDTAQFHHVIVYPYIISDSDHCTGLYSFYLSENRSNPEQPPTDGLFLFFDGTIHTPSNSKMESQKTISDFMLSHSSEFTSYDLEEIKYHFSLGFIKYYIH